MVVVAEADAVAAAPIFLVACTRLSVTRSVGPAVRWSVGWFVHNALLLGQRP